MAVPKRKTSKSKRNMRRSHHSLKKINIIEDKNSGEARESRIELICQRVCIKADKLLIQKIKYLKNINLCQII